MHNLNITQYVQYVIEELRVETKEKNRKKKKKHDLAFLHAGYDFTLFHS